MALVSLDLCLRCLKQPLENTKVVRVDHLGIKFLVTKTFYKVFCDDCIKKQFTKFVEGSGLVPDFIQASNEGFVINWANWPNSQQKIPYIINLFISLGVLSERPHRNWVIMSDEEICLNLKKLIINGVYFFISRKDAQDYADTVLDKSIHYHIRRYASEF